MTVVVNHPMHENGHEIELAQELFSNLIEEFEYDQPNTKRTAERWVGMMKELTAIDSYEMTVFPNLEPKVDQMVVVSPIPFYSLCAHHIIPFFGYAHVAYIPNESMVGISKIPRLVRATSKGIHTQETLTQTIADIMDDILDPVGVAVVMKAEHLCMVMRGVKMPGVVTTTSALKGVFLHPKLGQPGPKDEFFAIVNKRQ